MRDAAVVAILIVGVPLIGWTLVHGLQTGKMEAAGVPFASYTRSKNPFMFWLATTLNAAFLIVGAAFLITAML
ncbi:hypothetical protein ABDK56_06900 [Sphingomonas sp. ASV193]|uniref:hypothetical protein n=1 Tax=Sphingomonas sp. ASV193 TaxID=3144405 RepID=UPI0032E8D1F3